MGTGYTRNDTADNIADGNIINASDLDGEFDALQSAFDNSTGHTHDGTAGEGAPIEKVGPNQEVVVTATVLRPAANNTIDLGVETSNEFKNLYIDGTAYLDAVDIDGGTIDGLSVLTVDNLSLNGNTITSTDTNGNLNLRANGTGIISVDATDVNFGDSDKATFGDGSDLQIYHDGSNSYIDDAGTGNLQIRASSQIKLQKYTGENMFVGIADGAASMYYDNQQKLATTNTGIAVTGDVDASDDLILSSDSSKITFGADGDVELEHIHNVGLTLKTTGTGDDAFPKFILQSNEDTIIAGEVIGRIDFGTNSSAGGVSVGTQARITVDATDTYSSTVAGSRLEFYTTESGGALNKAMVIDPDQSIRFTGGTDVKLDATNDTLDFPDNFKIMMGAGDDLQIYHDGTNSRIEDINGANLILRSSADVRIDKYTGENMGVFNADGSVDLYYDNSKKLATTNTGVDITGGFTATDGSTITVDDNSVALDLICTDTDASSGPVLRLSRDVAGAASDVIGTVQYYGQDVAGNDNQYAEIKGKIGDATNGAEDGELVLSTMVAGTIRSRLNFSSTEAVFNDGSQDINFRVESNGNANMLFVDGGNDRVSIGHATPDGLLHLKNSDSTAYSATATDGQVGVGPTIYLENPANSNTTVGGQILFGMRDTEEQARIGATGGTAPALTFGTGDVERMRLHSAGYLSLGNNLTNPDNSLLHLTANSTDNFSLLQLESNDGGSSTAPDIALYRNSASPADSDNIGAIHFYGNNSAGDRTLFGNLYHRITDVTDGNEDSKFEMYATQSGSLINYLSVGSNASGTGEVVVNEGSADINFRVESNAQTNAFVVDAGTDFIGMHVGSALAPDGYTERVRIASDGDNLGGSLVMSANNAGRIGSAAENDIVFYDNDTATANSQAIGNIRWYGLDASGAGAGFKMGIKGRAQANGSAFLEFFSSSDSANYERTLTTSASSCTAGSDNVRDLGSSGTRWDDVFATNGTINTSDERLKQQVAALSTNEINAAKAISALFKTYKWNDKVAEKGDNARIHSGVIAQQVKAAMEANSLDPMKYAFMCWNEFYEIEMSGEDIVTPYMETFEVGDPEIPEGATYVDRYSIRYSELMSFIHAATEQRLASIESRLDALEAE